MLMNSSTSHLCLSSLCVQHSEHTHTHTHAQKHTRHTCMQKHTRAHTHTHTHSCIKHLHHTHMYVEKHTHTPSAASTKMYKGERKRASQMLCQCIWSSSSKLCRWRQQNHSMWMYLVIFIQLSCVGENNTNTPYEPSPTSERRFKWFLTCSHLTLKRTSCPYYLLQTAG